jgi:hypothetical protein
MVDMTIVGLWWNNYNNMSRKGAGRKIKIKINPQVLSTPGVEPGITTGSNSQ